MEESAANSNESREAEQGATPVDPTVHDSAANSPAEHPEPPTSTEDRADTADGDSPAASPAQDLQPLIDKARSGRLSPDDEAHAADALRALLLGRKEDLLDVVAAMPKLGWATSVKAVGAAWPEMKATARTAVLKALSAE